MYPERDYGRDDRKKRLWRECKTKIFSIFNHFSSLAELGIYSPCGSRGSISHRTLLPEDLQIKLEQREENIRKLYAYKKELEERDLIGYGGGE